MGGKPRYRVGNRVVAEGPYDKLENGFVRLIEAHATKELRAEEDRKFLEMMGGLE